MAMPAALFVRAGVAERIWDRASELERLGIGSSAFGGQVEPGQSGYTIMCNYRAACALCGRVVGSPGASHEDINTHR